MEFQNLTIHKDRTILDALEKLNGILYYMPVSRLILFVIDDKNVVVGSLTDGDIRRSLVAHADLRKPLGEICNKDFLFEFDSGEFLNLKSFERKNIKILPILNEKKELTRIIDLEKTKAILPLECMIMAGGRGKRLSPLTDDIPKPMLSLGDKPILEHNIDRLITFGIKKIYIAVKYLGEQIERYFGDGSKKGIVIEYIWEDEPLGTAGALSLVDQFSTEQVLLMNGDLFTNVDFEELYLELIENRAEMVVASTEYKVDVPYAILETQGEQVVKFREKPSFIYQSNAGIYILQRELIQEIPENQFFDITELMEKLLTEDRKLVYSPIRGFWIDIGKPVDYQQAQEFVKHLN